MSNSPELLQTDIEQLCLSAKRAALLLAQLSSAQKKQLLISMADCVAEDAASIFSINQAEVAIAKSAEISGAFLDRLTLSQERLHAMTEGIRTIAALPDPVGRTLSAWSVDSGLEILRVAMLLGVIAIIYESRPNVTADAAALCFYSGNAVILRGGSECG